MKTPDLKNIIIFSHPSYLNIRSIKRYAYWVADGMRFLGYKVSVMEPKGLLIEYYPFKTGKKYIGYVDSFLLFPFTIRRLVKKHKSDTLFVLIDQALGPWVTCFKDARLVIHCHDFLAQKSADGYYPQNPVSWTGKMYQKYIRSGFVRGEHFICISRKTEDDLLFYLKRKPSSSSVIYNGIDPIFRKKQVNDIVTENNWEKNGFLLHVGGNQWYKNRLGVIQVYLRFREQGGYSFPLVLIGEKLNEETKSVIELTAFQDDIHVFSNIDDERLCDLYNLSSIVLFPSLAEGFGWPIGEAIKCGTPVLTTDDQPMTEVGGDIAFYIPVMPREERFLDEWLDTAANKIKEIVMLTDDKRKEISERGLQYIKRFDSSSAINAIADVYISVMDKG